MGKKKNIYRKRNPNDLFHEKKSATLNTTEGFWSYRHCNEAKCILSSVLRLRLTSSASGICPRESPPSVLGCNQVFTRLGSHTKTQVCLSRPQTSMRWTKCRSSTFMAFTRPNANRLIPGDEVMVEPLWCSGERCDYVAGGGKYNMQWTRTRARTYAHTLSRSMLSF